MPPASPATSAASASPATSAAGVTNLLFPVPPRQHDAWTGDPRLPAALLDAAQVLFAQGFGDPRGCDYREIEVEVASVRTRDVELVKTQGFVLPGQRHAIAWNGLVYPVHSIGERGDLAADVAASLAKPPATSPKKLANEERASVMLGARLSTVVLLARRGEGSLAETLWRATGYDLTKAPDPYGELATEWLWRLYDRAITAHIRGVHALALDRLRLLAAVQPVVAVALQHRGIPRDPAHPVLAFLAPVPSLLVDEQRRAARGARPPLPDGRGMAKLPEAERVALLIEHLDDVAAPENWRLAGTFDVATDPVVEALIELGTPSVEPLIEAVASDPRLTRTVRFRREIDLERWPLAVHEVACKALERILQSPFCEGNWTGGDLSNRDMLGRVTMLDRIRTYWERWKSMPIEERWFQQLADDTAAPNVWMAAAMRITIDDTEFVAAQEPRLSGKVPASRGERTGEPLRKHSAPSVTDLILKRIPGFDDQRACDLALMLFDWDPKAGARELDRQLQRAIQGGRPDSMRVTMIAIITETRVDAGDLAVLDTYAAWIEKLRPVGPRDHENLRMFDVMSRSPLRPSIARAAGRLFRDGSPWLPLLQDAKRRSPGAGYLLERDLIVVPAFNRHVVKALADRSPAGRISMDDARGFTVSTIDGKSQRASIDDGASSVPPAGTERVVRMADWYGWLLARHHKDAPRFELFWVEAERDAALRAMAVWVKGKVAKR